jgi:Na+/H+ antiporter NhaC
MSTDDNNSNSTPTNSDNGTLEPTAAMEEAGTATLDQPGVSFAAAPILRPLLRPAFWVIVVSLIASLYVSFNVPAQWREQKTTYQVYTNESGHLAYTYKGKEALIEHVVPYPQSQLIQHKLDTVVGAPSIQQQWVSEIYLENGIEKTQFSLLEAKFHFGWWSLLPAIIAIALCLLTKEPLTALLGGIVVGAFMLGRFDITDQVLIPNLASRSAAGVLLLYLWLLGGLMGIWSRTGAAQAFAEFMTLHFVRGPRTAKLVAWSLGVIFFQGGTVSTVLVGTTVKPLADKEKISHEEMSYIVDSTASPIASVIAFNAWPAYIQALIFVPGVTFLATEADRLSFFFSSVPFSFYGILAVIGTLLLSLDITKFAGPGIKKARLRARETGQLDAPGAKPLSAKELQTSRVPKGYSPNVLEFLIPLFSLIAIAVGTFISTGSPKVNWAFGAALIISALIALFKGMSLGHLIEGFGEGLKGVVVASVILMLAITIGSISKEAGGGLYLVEQLGQTLPFWLLPVCLQLLTMIIAFSTGTSWGTYAIAFPLAMPLAWAIAQSQGVGNPEMFMAICFATVLNGSVYGDQCSPISDTTILSSMTTGCDLMDHVKTQIVPASLAAGLAALLWTGSVLLFV